LCGKLIQDIKAARGLLRVILWLNDVYFNHSMNSELYDYK